MSGVKEVGAPLQHNHAEDVGRAKVFMHGGSQAVRLPKAFRVEGDEHHFSKISRAIAVELPYGFSQPFAAEVAAVFVQPLLDFLFPAKGGIGNKRHALHLRGVIPLEIGGGLVEFPAKLIEFS